MIFFSRSSLERALTHYVAHYYEERNHQGLQNRLLKCSDGPTNLGRRVVRRRDLVECSISIIEKRPDDRIFRHYGLVEVETRCDDSGNCTDTVIPEPGAEVTGTCERDDDPCGSFILVRKGRALPIEHRD
jgi:hypothetical protein